VPTSPEALEGLRSALRGRGGDLVPR